MALNESVSSPNDHLINSRFTKDDGSPVSIFEYDFSQNKNIAPLAKNALRKLRTTRHPDVLKYLDAVESESTIYIMTERVRPLMPVLTSWSTKGSKEKEDWLIWGLHRISIALAFLNDQCSSTHGNLRFTSVFISPSGEWKLGGFEVLSNPTDDNAVLYSMGNILPYPEKWAAPEVKENGYSSLKQGDCSAADAYALGLLINGVFNPSNHPPPTANPPHPPPSAASRGAIPTAVFPLVKNLLNPSAKSRWSPKRFLETGMADSGFFSSNPLVRVCLGLDNFTLGSEAEKSALLRSLTESADSFPAEFATHRILPSLVKALEFGGASAATILPLFIKLGNNVPSDEYEKTVLASLVKLYASPDRGTRMALLDHLPQYADKLDKKSVDKIFPHLQTGFADTVAVIREATVKSIILLAPKFSDRTLNNDLLRHLARMQTDPEASIRTNTCILIGRLGPTLGNNTRKKVLVPAFVRALKDPFVHARVAGLMAFMATIECFDMEDLAAKVIPNVAPTLIDKEKLVRDQSFKAMELFMKRLESHASTMPATITTQLTEKPLLGSTPVLASVDTTLVNSAAGAAGALAGWAMSSIGRHLAVTDMQSTIAGAPPQRPVSAPPPEDISSHIGNLRTTHPLITSVSAVNSPAVPTFPGINPKAKGLQLGASKRSSLASASLIDQLTEEAAADHGGFAGDLNPWGSDDLMDVNADEDDWSTFETAPSPPRQAKPVGLGMTVNGSSSRALSPGPNLKPKITRPRTPQPASPDVQSDVGSPSVPLTPMTKEERATEMARRKEERKARIAMLKEQKKSATVKS